MTVLPAQLGNQRNKVKARSLSYTALHSQPTPPTITRRDPLNCSSAPLPGLVPAAGAVLVAPAVATAVPVLAPAVTVLAALEAASPSSVPARRRRGPVVFAVLGVVVAAPIGILLREAIAGVGGLAALGVGLLLERHLQRDSGRRREAEGLSDGEEVELLRVECVLERVLRVPLHEGPVGLARGLVQEVVLLHQRLELRLHLGDLRGGVAREGE